LRCARRPAPARPPLLRLLCLLACSRPTPDPDDAPALCLYLVPTRALAAEVENRLSRSLRGMGGRQAIAVTGLYGGTDWGPTDVWLSASSPTVLVCTQEKAEALVRYFGARVVERIRLVVVDEAHEVQERPTSGDSDPNESRALRLETLIARLRARLGTEARFVALSAVARGIQIPLARWISGDADRRSDCHTVSEYAPG